MIQISEQNAFQKKNKCLKMLYMLRLQALIRIIRYIDKSIKTKDNKVSDKRIKRFW